MSSTTILADTTTITSDGPASWPGVVEGAMWLTAFVAICTTVVTLYWISQWEYRPTKTIVKCQCKEDK